MKRNWNRKTDSGAVHAMGNGEIMVYGFGPEIIQVLASPISADNFCALDMPEVDFCVSERLDGTAIWKHTLGNGTVITDFVDIDVNCYQRYVVTEEACQMLLRIDPIFSLIDEESDDNTLVFEAKSGVHFFVYTLDLCPRRYVKVSGAARIDKQEDGVYRLTFERGCGSLYVSDALASIEAEEAIPVERSIGRITAYWQDFLSQMKPFPKWLADICENVGIMIKSQQASDGSILAGYAYHLAYVRDQFGVARGLLAMGFYREVEKMMYFYKMYFDRYGKVCNAQSVGHHGVFHVHENDHVEITGYLAILPFSVYDVNKSEQFMQDMLPMIRWCIECQIREMRDGMLPFNGDETYMAGGFLPRFAMYDGSAEATMLLARSIELYSIYTGDTQYDGVLTEIKETYLTNFIRNGRLMANIPERTPLSDYPAMRHGVCEDCGEVMAELTRNVHYRYVCDRCLTTHEPIPPRAFGSIELASSKLAPLYVGSELVPDGMMRVYLEEMVDAFHKDGQMPSGCPDGHAVGYDYGLFLYALAKAGHPAAKEICDLTVSILDETGVWCEYYQNGIPWKTRCRPWESAINIEGIIAFVEKTKG